MPTTLFTNGLLYLGAGQFERGGLVIDGDRITRVLTVAETEPAVDQVIDLAGGTLLPGFHDAHVHPLMAGMQLLSIDLHAVHDRLGYLHLIGEYADAHPEIDVITGGGWFGDVFDGGFPTAFELDAVVGDRPVVLFSHDAHGVWVSSAMLEAANIGPGTPDPHDGRIVRGGDGSPTGMLLDGAIGLVTPLVPTPDKTALEDALLAAQHRLHSVGVTSWQDAAVGESELGPNSLPVYEALDRDGRLTSNVVLAQWWERTRGLEQITEMIAVRDRLASSRLLDASTVKVMVDGMVENRTASMLQPFTGHQRDRGIAFVDRATLIEITIALDAAGFQVHFHAVGDAAVRHCLDAVEAAINANGRRGNRHHVAHLDLVHPADLARFADLDATANMTALWARLDSEVATRKLPLLGPERARHHFPFGSLHASGARLVSGSDWPVTDPNPLWAIRTAVSRTGVAEDPHARGDDVLTTPLLAEEALPLSVALDSYLSLAAFVNRRDDESGELREGAVADLVWVGADLRDIGVYGAAKVMQTLVAGDVVYRGE